MVGKKFKNIPKGIQPSLKGSTFVGKKNVHLKSHFALLLPISPMFLWIFLYLCLSGRSVWRVVLVICLM